VMSTTDQIFVKSHVARDLLQSAAIFKTDKLVVWEYVSNGLQYVDSGVTPIVKVTLDGKNKCIRIADNGRGMDWAGLQNFFVMHGENVDRKQGRPGRGMFGTGKSAAFGIAEKLTVTSVSDRKRSKVQLSRSEIDAMGSEDQIPVRGLEQEVTTDAENGTIVDIEGVQLRSLDQAGVIKYVERHLARWPKHCSVFVNIHECEVLEPPTADEIQVLPDELERRLLGDVRLVIKVAKAPLEEDLVGIAIFSNGVWHETTLAGGEGRPMSHYIFGEIEVSRLDDDTTPIAPFDLTRSMRLNPSNELVQAIYAFINRNVESVRKRLVEVDRALRDEEAARHLAREASKIASIINADFNEFRQRLAKVKAQVAGGSDLYSGPDTEGIDDFLQPGNEVSAELSGAAGGLGADGHSADGGEEPRQLGPILDETDGGPEAARRVSAGGEKRQPRGGFNVEFRNSGEESDRAQYVPGDRTIYVNLDHPQLAAARGDGSEDDPVFRRLAYEVAFVEYAMALAHELDARGEYIEPYEPIYDIKSTVNRVARLGAALYR
jgi:hypothetical protein